MAHSKVKIAPIIGATVSYTTSVAIEDLTAQGAWKTAPKGENQRSHHKLFQQQ